MANNTKWRRDTYANNANLQASWAWSQTPSRLSGMVAVLARMGEPSDSGPVGGAAALQGTRMLVERASLKFVAQAGRPYTLGTATVGHMVCMWLRGGGNMTTTQLIDLLENGISTNASWDFFLEGQVINNAVGTAKLMRHKVEAFSPYSALPKVCESRISRVSLQENEWMGVAVVPYPGTSITGFSSNNPLQFGLVTDIAYARQARYRGR